ncbi:MAG: PEP-CTERM sorting domain-containing protein [Verrucomicrobiota bacterium]
MFVRKFTASVAICVVAFGAETVFGGTIFVTANANIGQIYLSDQTTLVPTNGALRVGTFDISGGNLTTITTSNDFSTVNALFTPLAEGAAMGGNTNGTAQPNPGPLLIGNNAEGDGNISGSVENWTNAYQAPGTRIYWWVFNTQDPSNATEWGIFTRFASGTADWDNPGDGDFDFLTTSPELLRASGGSALRGSLTGPTSSDISLAAIPEPTQILLVLISGMLCLGIRRRR